MLQLLSMLDPGIVVTMGLCGFISARLSIFHLYMGTLIPLLKIPMGKWLWSLFPGPVARLRRTMVGLIVGSIQFDFLELRLLPNGVVNNGIGRLLR